VELRYRIDQPLCGMALDNLPPKSHLEVIEAALQHLLFCHCVPLEGANFKPAQAAVPITKAMTGIRINAINRSPVEVVDG
jgi:hypothetical protein